jgi:hypothetical protein
MASDRPDFFRNLAASKAPTLPWLLGSTCLHMNNTKIIKGKPFVPYELQTQAAQVLHFNL